MVKRKKRRKVQPGELVTMHRRKVPGLGLVMENVNLVGHMKLAHPDEPWVRIRWIKRPSAWEGMESTMSTYPVTYFRVYEKGDCMNGRRSDD